MKAKILLTILALSSALCVLSQVPQGINYQAIARDNKGDPITGASMQVRLGILSDTITPVTVWEELHSTIETNAFGMFTTVLGTGVRQSGSALTFADIDWTKTPLYLQTWIYYPSSWKYLGTSKICSVPYSLVAGGLDGALDKLEVKGDDISSDEALFEVKRKDGETMFAVYNHGVRVYMPLDTMSKARKGGFAIGGFDRAKGTVQDYFVVNPDSIRAYIDPNSWKARKGGFAIGSFSRAKEDIQKYFTVSSDSVRIYIDDNLSKTNKGGFAIGSFDRAKGGNANFFNVAPDSTGRIYPSQNRIQWYPLKNAFLTGKIIAENKDSIGENSFASGFESRAKGQYSQALGYKAIARGDYSTAIGKNAVAEKVNSFAFGQYAQAKKEESYAFGRGAIAGGYRSYAFGSAGVDSSGSVTGVAYARGDYSFAIGQGSQSLGFGSFTMGLADTAKGVYSISIGYKSASNGFGATSIGYGSIANGNLSTAIGLYSKANGNESLALVRESVANGTHSIAIGASAKANETGSIAMGSDASAMAPWSIAMGITSAAKKWGAIAIGYGASAEGEYSCSIGYLDFASGYSSRALGYQDTACGDYSTAIGYRTKASGGYALAAGGYTQATAANSTAMGWKTIASGSVSTALGAETQATNQGSTAMGVYSIASGHGSTAMGYKTQATGWYSTSTGYETISPSGIETAFGIYNTNYTPTSAYWWNGSDRLFVIGNGTGSSSRSDALVILKSGMTAIGHSYPAQMLDVNGNARFRSVTSGTFAYNLNLTADGTLTTATSDISMKEDISQIRDALDKIKRLRGVTFFWKKDSTRTKQVGMIAQEVEPIVSEIVFTNSADGLKGINYSQATALLVEAIKEQQQQIEFYKSRLQSLEEEVEQIKEMLSGSRIK